MKIKDDEYQEQPEAETKTESENGKGSFELPTVALHFDQNTLKIIEESRIRKLIGPLIAQAHAAAVRKIAIVSLTDEDATRYVAQLAAISLAQQLEKKCAVVVIEGIRINAEAYDSFNLITLPEIDDPSAAYAEKIKEYVEEIERTYPFQIFVAPNLNTWNRFAGKKADIAQRTEAQVLLLPQGGLDRNGMKTIEKATKEHGLKWLGVIMLQRNMRS